MAFCKNCGTQLPDNVAFCNACGTPTNSTQQVVYVKPKVPGRGFGISSMVLGIIGLVYAFIFAIQIPSFIDTVERVTRYHSPDYSSFLTPIIMLSVLSILSLCFSPAAIKRGYKNGISTSGMIMGTIGLIGYIYAIIAIISHM